MSTPFNRKDILRPISTEELTELRRTKSESYVDYMAKARTVKTLEDEQIIARQQGGAVHSDYTIMRARSEAYDASARFQAADLKLEQATTVNEELAAKEAAAKDAANKTRMALILGAAILCTVACVCVFKVFKKEIFGSNHSNSGGENSDGDEPDTGKAFLLSNYCLQEAGGEMLGGGGTGNTWWTGGTAGHYDDHLSWLAEAMQQMAETNQGVQGTLQNQAEQVSSGKRTLGNVLDGLMTAIPVAESLYAAGPAGPALSYNFQLASASAAVSTNTDTTNKMHEDARRNAANLTELAERYDGLLSRLSARGSASRGVGAGTFV